MQLQVHFADCRRSLSGASCCIANNCAQQRLLHASNFSRAHAFRNACVYRTSGSGPRIASQRTPPTSGDCKTFRRRAGCGLAVRTRACRCACSRAACVGCAPCSEPRELTQLQPSCNRPTSSWDCSQERCSCSAMLATRYASSIPCYWIACSAAQGLSSDVAHCEPWQNPCLLPAGDTHRHERHGMPGIRG